MASAALDAYNAWVDGLAVSAGQKTILKTRAKQLYAAVAKETIRHLRHHAQAVLADPDAIAGAKAKAQDVMDLADAIIARGDGDAWWLEAVGVS